MKRATRGLSSVWVWLLVLVMALGQVGCGGGADESASDGEATEQTEQAADAAAALRAVGGTPWVNSNEGGNLPIEAPELKDDLYLNTNYDYIAEHQLKQSSPLLDSQGEITESVTQLIADTSKKSPELEQLRILYDMMCGLDYRSEIGLSEVKPYSDKILAVTSIADLNELLASDDYPFVPLFSAYVSTGDMRGTNNVGIAPKFVLTDGANGGAEYYQETDDENARRMQDVGMLSDMLKLSSSAVALGLAADNDEVLGILNEVRAFEGSYGKFADYTGKWTDAEYGAYAKSNHLYTLEELEALCSNIPVRALLAKHGKDGAEVYAISSSEWLSELNKLWSDENLVAIKTAVVFSMMKDCFPILDPSLYAGYYTTLGMDPTDAAVIGFQACNALNTMSGAIAKVYVDEVLGVTAKDRLTQVTNDIIESYRELFQGTTWMSDEGKQRAIEKLDHMALNILEPDGAFRDYTKLKLTTREEGGTPLSTLLAIQQFIDDCDRELIGQPAQAVSAWSTIRATEMNCFYEPMTNSINILPGYVTSAVYTNAMTDQELLAGIGSVIGHEISHGFDYLGSQCDAYGTGNPIFLGDDASDFLSRRQRLVNYLDTIQISDGVYVNGSNKSVEGAADLCGVQAMLATAKKIEDLDYAKLFKDYARLWCQVYPAGSTLAIATDSHPLNYLRANVNVQMFDEFYDTFGIVEGDGMYLAPESRVVMWGQNA